MVVVEYYSINYICVYREKFVPVLVLDIKIEIKEDGNIFRLRTDSDERAYTNKTTVLR